MMQEKHLAGNRIGQHSNLYPWRNLQKIQILIKIKNAGYGTYRILGSGIFGRTFSKKEEQKL